MLFTRDLPVPLTSMYFVYSVMHRRRGKEVEALQTGECVHAKTRLQRPQT